jgi:sRNA-binding regulator protein Hfq
MGHLLGLQEYLDEKYSISIFDHTMASGKPWEFHLHGRRTITATVLENRKWDMTVDVAGQRKEELQKVQVKYLCLSDLNETIKPLIRIDKKVEALGLEPILAPRKRYFVKNKSLFPLMKEKEVMFFTLLEGEIIRGIIADFSRYDITVRLKGSKPVTILRHAIYGVTNKEGRSFLRSFQEEHRDWKKSPIYVS